MLIYLAILLPLCLLPLFLPVGFDPGRWITENWEPVLLYLIILLALLTVWFGREPNVSSY